MKELIKKISNNKTVIKLLEEFKKEFLESYKIADEFKEDILLGFRDTIFRKWIFSPIIVETYITPNYIINTIAQKIKKGEYTIMPHINIIKEKSDIKFDVKWIIYSKENNPVLEDLEILINYCNPTLIKREENIFILDDGEEIINKINFRSGCYIEYLLMLGSKMEILKNIDSIGCQVYQIGDKYDEYSKLSNVEKIEEIVRNAIEVAEGEIKKEYNINESNFIMKFLDNSITKDHFYNYFYSNGDVNDELLSEEGEVLNSVLNEELITNFKNLRLGVNIDCNFTCTFGYCLGIIAPAYEEMFFIELFLTIMKMAMKEETGVEIVFSLEATHEVTKFGEEILGSYKKEFSNRSFIEGNIEFLDRAVDHYLEMKEEYLMDLLTSFNSAMEFAEKYPDINNIEDLFGNMFNEIYDEDVSEELEEHLNEFYNYLSSEKKLKEKTCNTHYENIHFYIFIYMAMKNLDDLKNINKDTIHNFLVDWYIPNIATSKSNVKSVITSISQYLKFLKSRELINQEVLDDFKDISVNKDRYEEYYYECKEEDFLW